MALSTGARVGPYEIVSPLGAGAMGEVYRARDPRLNRDVAIKFLPDAFAQEAGRVARFTREAQTLAALNHPNIAQIYGVVDEPVTGAHVHALVMELVEGEDLSAVIARGPMPPAEAVPVARQIAAALEAAHEQGIIHRDLKPANVKVRADGTVKVLDFGLAKAVDPAGSGIDPATSPTITARTHVGMLIGSAAYMAPEQARGKAVDKRADIWAFGIVLYEMLTGRRAFEGEETSDVLAAVLRQEIDWTALPSTTPPHVVRLLERCLEKDRTARVPDASVVRFMLDAPAVTSGLPPLLRSAGRASSRRDTSTIWKAATAVLLLTTLAGIGAWYRQHPIGSPVVRFQVLAPDTTTFTAGTRRAAIAAMSPDGLTLAFSATDTSGKRQIWLRPVDSLVARPLAGTEGGTFPFWSPDSRSIGYSVPGTLMKIGVTGGPPQTLCALSGPTIVSRGAAWTRDGVIVFNNGQGPLYRVSAAGGQATAIGQLTPGETGRQFPSALPDGDHVLYFATASLQAVGGLYVTSLKTGESKRVLSADTGAVFVPQGGYLLFGRQGMLLAQAFDLKTLSVMGEPFPVAEHLETAAVPGIAAFSVSDTGDLAYGIGVAGDAGFELAWVDRQGRSVGIAGPRGPYRGIDLAPDDSRIAAHRHEGDGGDIWLTDLARGTTARFTFDASQDNSSPAWSRDGSRLAFAALRHGKWGVYAKPSDSSSSEERLFEADSPGVLTIEPMSWAPDGESLLMAVFDRETQWDLWLLSLAGARTAAPLLQTTTFERHGQVSPDGKWIAYMSRETGTNEIYVRSMPPATGKWAVSTGGGTVPRWRGDARELFFLAGGRMMAVDVDPSGSAFSAATPRPLFEYGNSNITHADYFPYAVTADGSRFLISRELEAAVGDSRQDPVVVVLNWAQELQGKAAAR
jgi:Tol biopolymer transport system component